MNVAKVYHVNRVRIFRSGCPSCALCPEHRLGVCSWGVWKWTSVQDQFCSWEPLPSASLFFLDSLPAFPHRAMGTDDNVSIYLTLYFTFFGLNMTSLVAACFSSVLWIVLILNMLLLCLLPSFTVPYCPSFLLQPLCLLPFFPKA